MRSLTRTAGRFLLAGIFVYSGYGMFNNAERKRLYKDAKTFLKLRSQRHKWVKQNRKDEAPAPEPAKA